MTIGIRMFLMWVCAGLMVGCSSSPSGPKLIPADGTVTFQGKPLVGATVMFVPDKGPLAMGVTDKDGKFQLSTGASRGVVVGPVKVSVTAAATAGQENPEAIAKRPQSQAEAEAYMKKAGEMQQAIAAGTVDPQPTSLIPEKYGKVETSGLSYTVKPAAAENHFPIEL